MTHGELDVALEAAYFEALAQRPGVASWRDGGVLAVRSGAPSNAENGIVVRGRGDVAGAVAFLDGVPARLLAPAGGSFDGVREDVGGVAMGASLDGLPLDVPAPPDVLIGLAEDEDVWEWALEEAELHLGDMGRAATRWLAWAGAVPVALGVSFVSGDAVALQHLWVREAARRSGIGRALSAARLRDAAARGATRAVLGPTPDSQAFHFGLGFELAPIPPQTVWHLPYREA